MVNIYRLPIIAVAISAHCMLLVSMSGCNVLLSQTEISPTARSTAESEGSVDVDSANTPTLTTISALATATEDATFNITYAALAAAADEADVEGTTLSF